MHTLGAPSSLVVKSNDSTHRRWPCTGDGRRTWVDTHTTPTGATNVAASDVVVAEASTAGGMSVVGGASARAQNLAGESAKSTIDGAMVSTDTGAPATSCTSVRSSSGTSNGSAPGSGSLRTSRANGARLAVISMGVASSNDTPFTSARSAGVRRTLRPLTSACHMAGPRLTTRDW